MSPEEWRRNQTDSGLHEGLNFDKLGAHRHLPMEVAPDEGPSHHAFSKLVERRRKLLDQTGVHLRSVRFWTNDLAPTRFLREKCLVLVGGPEVLPSHD